MPNQGKLASIAVLAAVAAAGCSPQQPKSTSGLTVSTHSTAVADASPAGLTLPNGIEITEIRMAVRRVFVDGDDAENACSTAVSRMTGTRGFDPGSAWSGAPVGDDACDHAHHGPEWGDDGRCDLAFGPFDVDLAGSALTGAVSFAFDVPVPPGTYEEVGIDVGMVSTTAAGGDPVLLALAADHASIVVDGFVPEFDPSTSTTTRVPFEFTTPMHVRQQREGKIAIGEGSNVTLDFDPSGWFTGPGGVRLDPSDPTARGDILANIRASIRLLSDDDHDGIDDGAEHGSGGGGMGHGH